MKDYIGYRPGFNAKGLPSRTYDQANPKPSTERGWRRKERREKTCAR